MPELPRVLVTGAAGCIGSELVERLLESGSCVNGIDNLSSGKREHMARFAGHPGFTFLEGDVLDRAALGEAMRGCSMVYHLAANPDVKYSMGEATDKDLQQNTMATYEVLEAMRRLEIRKLMFASTSAVYGVVETLPIPEDTEMRPISLYGATKLSCEAMISAFQHLFEMECWILRFANVVGTKVRGRGRTVISDFIARLSENPRRLAILGNGRQAKSYLHSTDCVDGILFAVTHAKAGLNVYNLGGGDWLRVDEIAEMVVEAMGLKDVEFTHTATEGGWPGDVPRFRLDVAAINQLGWRVRHNSRAAVKLAIDAILASNAETKSAGRVECRP